MREREGRQTDRQTDRQRRDELWQWLEDECGNPMLGVWEHIPNTYRGTGSE